MKNTPTNKSIHVGNDIKETYTKEEIRQDLIWLYSKEEEILGKLIDAKELVSHVSMFLASLAAKLKDRTSK